MESSGAGDYISELTYRQSGIFTVHDVPEMTEPLPMGRIGGFADFKRVMTEAEIRNLTAVSLQAREHNFGVILFPHAERKVFGSSGPRLMVGLALQLGLTLENYVVTHDAHRRTQEYELLTEIGKAISSRLDQDEVLRTIHTELGQIFDTSNFYIAFQEGRRYPLRAGGGGKPHSAQALAQDRKCFHGIRDPHRPTFADPLGPGEDAYASRGLPIGRNIPPSACARRPSFWPAGRPGVMVAMNTEREFVFEPRDLDVLVTAAGQVSVAVENARLFAEEQRRSRQLAFLNNVSRMAISSDDPMQMLGQIAGGDPEELQLRSHRHRAAGARNPGD